MLILTRRPKESILIGDDIVVTCLGRDEKFPDQIRLGISAPKHINIARSELVNASEKES